MGHGLLFAGQNHVHVGIEASDTEKMLINTNPNNRVVEQKLTTEDGVSGYFGPS